MSVQKFNQLPDELISVIMGFWSPREAQKKISFEWRKKMEYMATNIRRIHYNQSNDRDLADMEGDDEDANYKIMYKMCDMYFKHTPRNNIIKCFTFKNKSKLTITIKGNILQGERKKILDIIERDDMLINGESPPETIKEFVKASKLIIKNVEAFERTTELFVELVVAPYTQNIEFHIAKSRNFWG